jgi:hypothetical protein
MSSWHRLALAGCLALSSACVQVAWERHEFNSPLEEDVEQELVAGEVSLKECLAQLGAPLLVWELSDSSYALAYGWDRQREYGVSFSVPVADSGRSASINYDDIASKAYGVVLIFDSDDRLLRKRRGLLRDLAPEQARRRPLFSEDVGDDGTEDEDR